MLYGVSLCVLKVKKKKNYIYKKKGENETKITIESNILNI